MRKEMTMTKFKSLTPILLAATVFAGSVFIYSPEDAHAMPSPADAQTSLEQLVNKAEG